MERRAHANTSASDDYLAEATVRSRATGRPAALDRTEPAKVAESVKAMGLRYTTVTGVSRDDLPDGGAWLYAETVR